jgi:phosphohistidine phosphatase
MDLILWRHAEAEDWPEGDPQGGSDLERSLTSRGEKQAARMANWLDRQLPEGARIFVSPARRCEQTALALGRKYKIRNELAPDATVEQLLELVQWPTAKSPILVGLQEADCPVKKGAVWWLRNRDRDGIDQTVVVTVQSPEVL